MKQRGGFLGGQLLIAMPGMNDKRFIRSVIYICAHSDAGAMGIILNQLHHIGFPELLLHLGVINSGQKKDLSEPIKSFPYAMVDLLILHVVLYFIRMIMLVKKPFLLRIRSVLLQQLIY